MDEESGSATLLKPARRVREPLNVAMNRGVTTDESWPLFYFELAESEKKGA